MDRASASGMRAPEFNYSLVQMILSPLGNKVTGRMNQTR